MRFYSGAINELASFKTAFANTKREMLLSLIILLLITFVLSWIFYFSEHLEQPDVFSSYWDAVVWAHSRYIEGGDGVFEGGPVTVLGRTIAFMLGLIGIAIVAIPAGLIGSGFMDAIADEKRSEQLKKYHQILLKSFKLQENRSLREYLQSNPQDWCNGAQFRFVPNNITVSKYELRGIDLKDILETCERYPQFRVKNEAMANSIEARRTDRYVLECFPVNTAYGYVVNRGSKVTIVSTSGQKDLGIGNFSYYLAKEAGFNYISKDFDADIDDSESYYNNTWGDAKIDGKTLAARVTAGEKVSKSLRALYAKKQALRDAFVHDLESLCQGEDRWVICMLPHLEDQANPVCIHVASETQEAESTILNTAKYQELISQLTSVMDEQFSLKVEKTRRYPLIRKGDKGLRNIAFKLQEDGHRCNCLTLRISSQLMAFDARMRVVQFAMANTIHNVLTPDAVLADDEVKDLNRIGYSFSEHELNTLSQNHE